MRLVEGTLALSLAMSGVGCGTQILLGGAPGDDAGPVAIGGGNDSTADVALGDASTGGSSGSSSSGAGGSSGSPSSGSQDATMGGDAFAEPDVTVTDASGTEAGPPDAAAPMPQSCRAGGDGLTNCGSSGESCCTSLDVPGGTFYRTYSNDGTGPTGEADPATVSAFRLDKYDVTVGRFRQFVNAVLPPNGTGWLPPPGSGKHTHLNGGLGLANVASDAGSAYEPGWLPPDDLNIVPSDANLSCDASYQTWTHAPGGNESRPMTCVNWWEAYAFCIWDGGFLPSDAEWEYAAAGGSEQRRFPWGSTDPGTANQYAIFGLAIPGYGDCYYPTGTAATCTGWRTSRRWGRQPSGPGAGVSSIWRATLAHGRSTGSIATGIRASTGPTSPPG